MFRMFGNKLELIRYTITYTENEREMVESCISVDHKNEIEQVLTNETVNFTTKQIDQSANEWLNGLEFDSYDEALSTFDKGEEEFKKVFKTAKSSSAEQLRADTDYLAIMTGVDL